VGATQSSVTWVLTAYLLSASICTPIVGRLGDMYGKKRLLVVALAVLALGSLLAALATSLTIIVIARAVQGVGGGVLPLAFGIVRDEFPPEKVAGAVGMVAALTSVGAGLGVVLAGPIVDSLSYHWLFWIPFIMVSLACIAAQVVVPESPAGAAGRINWLNGFLLSTWLVALLLGMSQAAAWGWGSGRTLSLMVVAVLTGVIWVAAETRSANPLVDMEMMRIRTVWAANLVALVMGIGMYAAFSFLPQFLQTPTSAGYGLDASVTESGLMLLPITIGVFVLGLASGRLGYWFGSKRVLVAGSMVSAIGYLMVAFLHSSDFSIYIAMSVVGIGLGLAFPAMSSVVVGAVPSTQSGIASGMNVNIRTIGGALGAVFMARLVTAGVPPGDTPREAGYTNGFFLLGVVVIFGALAALFIPATGERIALASLYNDAGLPDRIIGATSEE